MLNTESPWIPHPLLWGRHKWIWGPTRSRGGGGYWWIYLTNDNLKVWSTVKICGTRVPQNAIVPVGRPRPYSIIILNMRFIPKASLRASSQITATSYILERHLWVNNSKPFALALTWSLGCKQADCITAWMTKLVDLKLVLTSQWTQNICMTLYNVGPTSKTLSRRCINVLQMCCVCWAGERSLKHSTFV